LADPCGGSEKWGGIRDYEKENKKEKRGRVVFVFQSGLKRGGMVSKRSRTGTYRYL